MKGNAAATILRWGLAFVLFYSAVESLRRPEIWANYLPAFLTSVLSAHFLLAIFAACELIVAIWLFWGKKLAWSSMLAAIAFVLAVIVNLNILDAVFYDIGLAMAALALFELAHSEGLSDEEAA